MKSSLLQLARVRQQPTVFHMDNTVYHPKLPFLWIFLGCMLTECLVVAESETFDDGLHRSKSQYDQCFSNDTNELYWNNPQLVFSSLSNTCHPNDTVDYERNTAEVEETLRSFQTKPTKGQHLILVPKDSPYRIKLDENIAYQLRQTYGIHNTNPDDLLYKHRWSVSFLSTARPNVNDNKERISTKSRNKTITSLENNTYDNNNNYNNNKIDDDDYVADDDTNGLDQDQYVPLLMQSHPEQAIVALGKHKKRAGYTMLRQEDYLDLGIGDRNDALQIRLWSHDEIHDNDTDEMGRPSVIRRYVLQTKDRSVFIVSSDMGAGAPVTLTSLFPTTDLEYGSDINDPLLLSDFYQEPHCHFIVNEDGTISSLVQPQLVIGITPYPAVTLVPRNSTHRLLFRHAHQFWSAPAPVNGVPLELASHPGFAVVAGIFSYHPFNLMTVQELAIGTIKNSLRLFSLDDGKHHQFLLTTNTTYQNNNPMTLLPLDLQLGAKSPLRLVRYSNHEYQWLGISLNFAMTTVDSATWIINLEGSISPLNAPGMVLGCEFLPIESQLNTLITKEQKQLADKQVQTPKKDMKFMYSSEFDIVGILRNIHFIAIWIATGNAVFKYMSFLGVFLILTFMSMIPYTLWVAVLIYIFFGSVAAFLFAIFEITGALIRRVFAFWRPKHDAEGIQQQRHAIT